MNSYWPYKIKKCFLFLLTIEYNMWFLMLIALITFVFRTSSKCFQLVSSIMFASLLLFIKSNSILSKVEHILLQLNSIHYDMFDKQTALQVKVI